MTLGDPDYAYWVRQTRWDKPTCHLWMLTGPHRKYALVGPTPWSKAGTKFLEPHIIAEFDLLAEAEAVWRLL